MKLLVSYQLYQPVEINAWTELHQLFLLAERQKLTSQIVEDQIAGNGSPLRPQAPRRDRRRSYELSRNRQRTRPGAARRIEALHGKL